MCAGSRAICQDLWTCGVWGTVCLRFPILWIDMRGPSGYSPRPWRRVGSHGGHTRAASLPNAATEGCALVATPSVLIVDPSEETREVLQTALERRGVRTLSAGHIRPALQLIKEHGPDLVVLDAEASGDPAEAVSSLLSGGDIAGAPHLVVLGSFRRPPLSAEGCDFVAKPYHYGPLIRKIEELLTEVGCGARKA